MDVNSKVKELVLSAQITRADGTIEDLGAINYWHSSFIKRLLWSIKQWLR